MVDIIRTQRPRTLIAIGALILTACGGGGADGTGPVAAASQTIIAGQAEAQVSTQRSAPADLAGGNAQHSDGSIIAASAEDTDATTSISGYTAPSSLAAQTTVVATTSSASVLKETFDEKTMTGFGKAVVDDDDVHLVSGKGVHGSNAIKVSYRGNSRGSERVIVNYKLPRSLQYTLSFDVNFCSGFDFRKGGKLHGLGPANPVAGGNEVSSPRWSARSMFRSQGGLQSYIYSQNMSGKYGDVVIARDFHFQPDRYYAITFQVALNNPASASNGSMRVFVDGTPVIYHDNIKFRSTESLDSQISTLMFNTFHGGHTDDWAPRNADGSYAVNCAYFDNFAAYPSLEVRYAPGM